MTLPTDPLPLTTKPPPAAVLVATTAADVAAISLDAHFLS